MTCSKKVLITGATGLIGKQLYAPLAQAGFDSYALTIDEENPAVPHVTWLKANVFDEPKLAAVFEQLKPDYLLNMAWCASGDYQTSDLNFDFVRAGLTLLKHFQKNGGKRAVFTGTCLEYAPQNTPIAETDPLSPTTPYAHCKNALHVLAEQFCQKHDISFAYGRIFYVYGQNEHPARLTASIINHLRQGQPVTIKHAQLQKDYLYTKDIAAAFVRLLAGSVNGAVNICSGKAISLTEFATQIAQKLHREDLLDLQTLPTTQPLCIVGNNKRLREEVGFTPSYTLSQALDEILNF